MPNSCHNPAAKLAMQAAWTLARRGWAIYGGPKRSFLREALRIAWAELKAEPVFVRVRAMIAEIRAQKSRPRPAVSLSPGLLAAAARCSRRHGARAYGGGFGSARFTAGW
ncbi:MAG: hypothetical protein ACHQF3_00150 [Alphaproteobacteria bacterium]